MQMRLYYKKKIGKYLLINIKKKETKYINMYNVNVALRSSIYSYYFIIFPRLGIV